MKSPLPSLQSRLQSHWACFALALVLTTTVYAIYAINIVTWRNSPDFGWRAIFESGPNVVGEVLELGTSAGLLAGDRIVSINGQQYSSFDELYFKIRHNEPGSINTYTVMRDGQLLEVRIATGRLGFKAVLARSGPFFGIGLLYVFLGIVVFLMKPQAGESWLFFVMACLFGMELSFFAPSDLIRPLRFFDVRLLIDVILPAPIIHLALRFPKSRGVLERRPWLLVLPYLASLTLFVSYKLTATAYWQAPAILGVINDSYLMTGVLIFLLSMAWNSYRDSSVVIRLQSQVIFLGIVLAFFIPVANLLALTFWQVHLLPSPAMAFAICLIMFPLSIGYTIVKHDLFAIDVIVRRTYGYVLTTATIVGSYALIVLVLNVTFQSSEIYTSPLFSIVFALGVVFTFRPLHERFQGFVDRVFYRQRYDYRKTIKAASEAMIRILDPGQIHKTLIGSLVKEMFLENGLLLLPNSQKGTYHVQFCEGGERAGLAEGKLDGNEVLPQLLEEHKNPIFRHEIPLNPLYEPYLEPLQLTFDALASELMLPLTYQDEMRGIISLGRKKSGKMFTLEDLDLLKTVTNQSSIALENAKLFLENIEKSRMEEELKIARDLQSSMLPESSPQVEGFAIAARCIPAREVGGDFYDFIEIPNNSAGKRMGIIVGDVSGKAVSGALVMAASRSIFRVLSGVGSPLSEVMSTGNARLGKDVKKGMFVALLYGVLDSRQRTLTLSNAGQTQPILCPVDGSEPRYLVTEGDTFPLGILDDVDYRETRIPLEGGDTVVFYTDGVVEAMNGNSEIYGFERLVNSIGEGRHLEAEAMLHKLLEDVERFVGGVEQHDDLTVVVVKVD
jgi:serine phosphatase RsbU (regulator of sigma subunit)